MKVISFLIIVLCFFAANCDEGNPTMNNLDIKGFNLLTEVTGHWVGTNETVFGFYDWFAFDFRPISAAHTHSIYEGATAQSIITSFFVADFEGTQQIMARNGGWLGTQYRASYFVLDKAEESEQSKYYRLVDAVGGVKRSYMELRLENDTLYFDAYKDNSGTLDEPIHHMGFKGTNYNASFAQAAITLFDFPQKISEVNLNDKFGDLIDPDSALFLEESQDPFPRDSHGHVSELTIQVNRSPGIQEEDLLFYLSTEAIVSENGVVNFDNLDQKVVRTIAIASTEDAYTTTYLHPGNYYITVFADTDNNFYPSSEEYSSRSKFFEVSPESDLNTSVNIDLQIE